MGWESGTVVWNGFFGRSQGTADSWESDCPQTVGEDSETLMTLHPSLPRATILLSNTLSCCPLKDTPLWQTVCPDFFIQKSHLFDTNILIALELSTGAHGHCSQDRRTMTLWLHTVEPGLLSFSLATCLEGFQVLRIPDIDLLGKPASPVCPPITWASPSLFRPCPHWLVWLLGPSHSPFSLSFQLCSCCLL